MGGELAEVDGQKRAAAAAAAALVEDGMTVGLGTGSTAAYVIAALIRRVAEESLRIEAVPTSIRSAEQASAGGISLTDLGHQPRLDLTIDGADQVVPGSLDLIKGLGGALLREKIVAAASARLVIVVDGRKLSDRLTLPVPVEVVEFGWQATARKIAELGGQPVLRGGEAAPFRTDGGNLILDCTFGTIADPPGLDRMLKLLVGVVETGLFIDRAERVLAAEPGGVRTLLPSARTREDQGAR
ncbi:ribose-5-phosphate isomerase RpiA [Geminicoccus harenae]|uniref:ribose-5-phosphate isomerase RpiA n=1 Tax=Geminicoccus harenae TaxID=2498453 RepID=UPI00168B9FB5|nr:ribose-5-phosphate isomerase RpiA [Geminicoccus harenae]